MLSIVSILIVGAATFYLAWTLFAGELEGDAARRLASEAKTTKSGILRLSRPVFTSFVMPYTLKWKREDWAKKTRRRIIAAGLEDEIDTDELFAFQVFLGVVIPVGLYVYFLASGSPLQFGVFLGMIAVGYAYPMVWIGSIRSARHTDVKLQLPFVIDLLTLSTEAGLDFIGALQKVVEKTRPGPLVQELERMLQQIQLGTTRGDALRDLGWRLDLQEISSLVAVLVTADQMGSPLGAVLRVQSELIRSQRFTLAEKKGAQASQKLLFPLIFCVMPAVFIMIFGPVVIGFFGSGK